MSNSVSKVTVVKSLVILILDRLAGTGLPLLVSVTLKWPSSNSEVEDEVDHNNFFGPLESLLEFGDDLKFGDLVSTAISRLGIVTANEDNAKVSVSNGNGPQYRSFY